MNKKNLISAVKYLLFVSLGIGLMWWIFNKQDIPKIISDLKNANYYWVVLSMIVGALSHVSRAIRWNILMAPLGYKTKTSTTFYAVLLGYLANLFIPRAGEITRCGIITKTNKIPLNAVIGTVIAERIFDMVVLLFILMVTIVFQYDKLATFINYHILSNSPLSSTTLIYGAFIAIALLIGGWYMLIKLIFPYIKKYPFFYKIKRILVGFIQGIKAIITMERKWAFLFHTGVIWLMYVLMVYLCFFALPQLTHLTFVDSITIMALGSLGIVFPSPGGIGSYHAIIILLLTGLFFIDIETATSYALITHSSQMLLFIILGGIAFFLLFLENKISATHDSSRKN